MGQWDYGDQLRICDGLLYFTLIHALQKLKASGAVISMELVDYDLEELTDGLYFGFCLGTARAAVSSRFTIIAQ